MVNVRPLADSDSMVELTSLLHKAYARLAAMGLNYTAADQSINVTASRIKGGSCFVAELRGKLVGSIVVQPGYTDSHCPYFTRPGVACAHQFAVSPQHQGQGIGGKLLAQVEHWAWQANFTELALDTAEQATHLVEFYSRHGYRQVGWATWPGKVYRSVVLSKRLGDRV